MSERATVDASHILDWLTSRVARVQGVDPRGIDVRERFSRYGLDSQAAAGLLAELGQALGRTLAPTLVWDHPTFESLARHLAGDAVTAPASATPRVATDDPIAIVGMACRFPGAPDLTAYWRLLIDGVDAVGDVPASRWDTAALYDPDRGAPGKLSTRRGGFLDQVDRFDPQCFGISGREAAQIDPQQRLVLELAWEALADAGIPARGLRGSATAVFVGAMWSDYAALRGGDLAAITAHTATGQDLSIIPARVSYTFGLQGPSVAIDTACSSSLVAVHLACQSLRAGEATLALAGGVNLLLAPDSTVMMSKFGAMAPDGRSKAFDARADGYVRGEGGGLVVLKPLSRALADGDPIVCVIRGSAINNDGLSNGLTAPNPAAQADVLRAAYTRAGVDPATVGYVEAHGTGTLLGDPIEAGALGAVLGAGRAAERPLRLGSVKTNIGHLEAAAGIAGLIKAALSLARRTLVPSLHFERPNPHIPFAALHLAVQTKVEPWPDDDPPIAGVSSFGFGGTNSHVVLQGVHAAPAFLLPLAAADEGALRTAALRLVADPDRTLADLCADAVTRPTTGPHRLALTARTRADVAAHVDAFLAGHARPGLASGVAEGRPRVVFMFGGQGSQWPGMGRDLLRDEPAFAAALRACAAAIAPHVEWSPLAVLAGDDGHLLDRSDVAQPCIFAIQVALAALWRSLGVEPDAVVGQSMGEVAAAHVAGALGLGDAAAIICRRSRIVARVRGQGGMAVTGLSLAEAARALRGREDRLSIAVSSSPRSTVLAGDAAALAELLAELQRAGVFCQAIKVDYASHSPAMDPLLAELAAALRDVRPRAADVPFVSTVTGTPLDGAALDADYWARNLREPVLFAGACELLRARGSAVFLDVNPHPVLARAVEQTLAEPGAPGVVVPSMRRGEDGRGVLLDALGVLFTRGAAIRGPRIWPPRVPRPVDDPQGTPELCALSAHTPAALAELAAATAALLRGPDPIDVRDLCHTASARRDHHAHRLAVVAASREDLAAALVAAPSDAEPVHAPPRVVFVFPGQGTQWPGMGRRLLATEPVFRDAIAACERALAPHVDWRLTDELRADPGASRLAEIDVVQPVLWAVQVALAALWRSWGVEPAAVVGHSLGEVAAAHVAGILDLDDAALVITARSRLIRAHASGSGAMAVVELAPADAERALAGREALLAVGVHNGPRSSVLSGDPAALAAVLDELRERGVFCRPVKVDYASHSPQMDALERPLLAALDGLAPRPARVPLFSTVTAGPLAGPALDAAYWVANLRRPVRFAEAVHALAAAGHDVFLEQSPHPALLPAIDDGLRALGRPGVALGSLRRDEDERACLLTTLATLYVRGADPTFARLFPQGGRVVPLPPYPFQRERHWIDPPARRDPPRPLLPAAPFTSPAAPGVHVWAFPLALAAAPYLADHRVRGAVMLPAAAILELALAAATQLLAGPLALVDVTLRAAVVLAESDPRTLQLVITDEPAFQLYSRTEASTTWTLHADGKLRADAPIPRDPATPAEIQRRLAEVAVDHAALAARGYEYGPTFRGAHRLWRSDTEALARVGLPDALRPGDHLLHPALLDACLQALLALLPPGDDPLVPVRVREFRIHRRPAGDVYAHAVRHAADASTLAGDVIVHDETGDVIAEIRGLELLRLPRTDDLIADVRDPEPPHPVRTTQDLERPRPTRTAPDDPGDLLALEWRLTPLPPPTARPGRWLLLADHHDLATEVQAQLTRRGESATALSVDPPESLAPRLHAALADMPCRGVVHLAALDAPELDATTAPTPLDTAVFTPLHAAITVVQAVIRAELPGAPRLWLVTRDAHAVGAAARVRGLAQSPLAGLGQTLLYEQPELRCARVDLGDATGPAALADELCADTLEDLVALRPDGRHVARLVRRPLPPATPIPVRSDGTYLISGGLGGLGLALARWLVEHGARHLLLLGRHGAREPAQLAAVDALARAASVTVISVDVADHAALARALADARARMPPLRGLAHAAGVLDDALVPQQTADRLRRVLAPKVDGAWNLHALTLDDPLEWFLLHSSAAALLGSPGQSNYAAANAFLDALAHHRRARGLPALAVDWGPFTGVGLAAADDLRGARLADRGMGSWTVAQGHAILERLLASPATQVGAVRLDIARWLEAYPSLAASPQLSALAPPPAPARREPPSITDPTQRLARIEQTIITQAIKVLRVDPARIRRTTDLMTLGVDSLLGLELRNRLEIDLGLKFPATTFWKHRRIDALAAHLLDLLGPEPQPEPTPSRPPGEPTPPATRPPTREPLQGPAPGATPSPPRRPREPTPLATQPPQRHEAPPRAPLDEPIAVIGVSGRYPRSPDLDAFWANLHAGRNCLEEVPPDRWDRDEHAVGRWGGFLDDIAGFDPGLFHLSPAEARAMDPAERLVLETAFRTFEDAGHGRAGDPRPGLERRVGVFVGAMYNQYAWLADDELLRGTLFNNSYFAIANRVSHYFDLRGPSLAIDTACSSSLVAIHTACESLRRGECALALAGGVNLTLHPYKYLGLRAYGMLGSEGMNRSLGAGDGFVPGEGVGLVLLKPLAAARRDGDRIDAVLLASAVNHNGRGPGYTTPNPDAQAELIAAVLARAGLTPDRLHYLELAANGLPLGDESEIAALTEVFKNDSTAPHIKIPIGTVKSNLGHLEAASGISQLTKVLLQIRHRRLVPSIHADPPNPHLALERTPLRIQTAAADWDVPAGEPRRALISSFGGGGTNACLVVEEHIDDAPTPIAADETTHLLAFSAPDPARLDALLATFADHLARAEPALVDLARTLLLGRPALAARVAFTARTLAEVRERLIAARAGDDPDIFRGEVDPGARPLRLFEDDEDLREMVARWLARGRLARLAELWVHGVDVDWRLLPWTPRGRPIPLPGVPFAKIRLWPSAGPRLTAPQQLVAPERRDAHASPVTPEATVLDRVRVAIAELLHLDGPDAIHPDQELRRYGFDSLSGLRLINRLAPDLAKHDDRRVLLGLRTARAWADRLAATPADPSTTAAPATLAATDPPADDLHATLTALAAGRLGLDEALARNPSTVKR